MCLDCGRPPPPPYEHQQQQQQEPTCCCLIGFVKLFKCRSRNNKNAIKISTGHLMNAQILENQNYNNKKWQQDHTFAYPVNNSSKYVNKDNNRNQFTKIEERWRRLSANSIASCNINNNNCVNVVSNFMHQNAHKLEFSDENCVETFVENVMKFNSDEKEKEHSTVGMMMFKQRIDRIKLSASFSSLSSLSSNYTDFSLNGSSLINDLNNSTNNNNFAPNNDDDDDVGNQQKVEYFNFFCIYSFFLYVVFSGRNLSNV